MGSKDDHPGLARQLVQWLQANRPEDLLMPLADKNPRYCHKNGAWNWELLEEKGYTSRVGILMRTLICLDVDSKELGDDFMARFPQWFEHAVIEETSKGYHFIWARTAYCEKAEITDGARQLEASSVEHASLTAMGKLL